DRDIEVGSVRLKLFPALAVALEDVTVARWRNSGGAAASASGSTRPLADVARIELRPRLLPLLRREAVIHTIVIDQPRLFVEVDGAADPVPEGVRDEAAGFWDNSTVQIESFQIRNGSVAYHDLVTGDSVRVEGVDQELGLRAELREGELARLSLTGEISAANVNAHLPERLAV